jgi:hypothetical protein
MEFSIVLVYHSDRAPLHLQLGANNSQITGKTIGSRCREPLVLKDHSTLVAVIVSNDEVIVEVRHSDYITVEPAPPWQIRAGSSVRSPTLGRVAHRLVAC